ncbi:MAG TPA: FKBP-type peptidyl-prolyl cis-trans isomerase [Thermoanaerobaculia bacterium]|nr:FKBP-type peptidyl-prolyl cis-trans isomerase [Thermoanaerobaculia bacterium]
MSRFQFSSTLAPTLVILVGLACAEGTRAEGEKPESLEERFSYTLGYNLGVNLERDGVAADTDLILRGLRDALAGSDAAMTEEEMAQCMDEMRTKLQAAEAEAQQAQSTENRARGEEFLAQNKSAEGVIELESGLQYKVLQAGDGATPQPTSRVRVHYEGRTLDGEIFDSSYQRGEPVSFALNQVIAGWSEGVSRMTVGSKWQLFIPSELAYGSNPPPGALFGPDAVLVFDVELLGIEEN